MDDDAPLSALQPKVKAPTFDDAGNLATRATEATDDRGVRTFFSGIDSWWSMKKETIGWSGGLFLKNPRVQSLASLEGASPSQQQWNPQDACRNFFWAGDPATSQQSWGDSHPKFFLKQIYFIGMLGLTTDTWKKIPNPRKISPCPPKEGTISKGKFPSEATNGFPRGPEEMTLAALAKSKPQPKVSWNHVIDAGCLKGFFPSFGRKAIFLI